MKVIAAALLAIALGGCSIALDPIERWSSSKETTAKKEPPAASPAAQPAQEPGNDTE